MKVRKPEDIKNRKAAREVKVALMDKSKNKQTQMPKEDVLLQNIKTAVDELKKAVEGMGKNNEHGEALSLIVKLIDALEKKPFKVDVQEAKRPVLKSVRPVRDSNGMAKEYKFEWGK